MRSCRRACLLLSGYRAVFGDGGRTGLAGAMPLGTDPGVELVEKSFTEATLLGMVRKVLDT